MYRKIILTYYQWCLLCKCKSFI